MVFIKKVLFLCCLPIIVTIVMPINCNEFSSEIDQSFKRFPRQVEANNDQQIGANDTNSLDNFGASIKTDVHEGEKNVIHDKSSGPAVLPGRNNERRGRQLNIYSPAQESNRYARQDYASQSWYLANKDYYDNYYANYYQSYYQTTTESIRQQNQQPYPSQVVSNTKSPTSHNQQQSSQVTSQSNQQSSSNRLNSGGTLPSTLALNGDDGDSTIYIDENGLFQISKSNLLNAVSPLIDDDAIVFQSDESQYDRRTYFLNDNIGKPTRRNIMDVGYNSKTISFNGLPVFSN